jgi:hypothetical protein
MPPGKQVSLHLAVCPFGKGQDGGHVTSLPGTAPRSRSPS